MQSTRNRHLANTQEELCSENTRSVALNTNQRFESSFQQLDQGLAFFIFPLTSYRSSLSFQLHSFTQPSVGSVSFNSQLHSFPLVSHSLRQAKLVPGNHSLLCKSTSLLLGCMGKTSKACTWWSFLINLWFIFTHRKIVQSTKGQLLLGLNFL